MKKHKIAFFDTKPYDENFFDLINQRYQMTIKYFTSHLTMDNVALVKGFDAVCVFVNDQITRDIADRLKQDDVKLIALRSAGYNNVDLKAVYKNIHVVRVPAYSPYAVAEHAVALILTLNRKTHKAYYRTRDNNFNIKVMFYYVYQKFEIATDCLDLIWPVKRQESLGQEKSGSVLSIF